MIKSICLRIRNLRKLNVKDLGIKNWDYFFIALVVFVIEVVIVVFFQGTFVRHVIGDFFVVILIYAFFRSFTIFDWRMVALGVLIFSYLIEISQWLNILELLKLKRNLSTDLIVGSSFDWRDMVAYTCGIGLVAFVEKIRRKK